MNVEKKTVPLIDRTGDEPKVIGEAEVEIVDGEIEIKTIVIDGAIRSEVSGHFSIAPDTSKN